MNSKEFWGNEVNRLIAKFATTRDWRDDMQRIASQIMVDGERNFDFATEEAIRRMNIPFGGKE